MARSTVSFGMLAWRAASTAARNRGCAAPSARELGRPMRRQAAAQPQRRDAAGEAARLVGLDDDAAQRARPLGDLQPLARHLAGETGDRRLLLHADDRIVV